MRVVVDTNVFISAMLSGQTPKRVYQAFLNGKITPIFSAKTLGELIEVLSRPHLQILRPVGEVARFIALIERDAIIVTPIQKFQACRDSKDNIILDCAVAGDADCIITGDKDLLVLHPFHKIPILKPSEFLKHLN